ncbi:GIY-YIG nuclease family protein [Streptomyces gardneri]|uniref:GIY-YIG nuclease family protein n=1 Tax=Streptomyces gardneri TaxID=66892 RepID=UPI0037D5CB1F
MVKSKFEAATVATEDVWNATTHPPVVYFLTNGDRIKIGTSRNIRARVGALSLRPRNASLLLNGDRELERALHHAFTAHRLGTSEWFVAHPDIQAFIKAKAGTEPEDPPATAATFKARIPVQRQPTAEERVTAALRENADPAGHETIYVRKAQITFLSGLNEYTLNNTLTKMLKAGSIHR